MPRPVSLLSCARLTVDPSWAAKRHSHGSVEMMVMHGGRLAVEIGEASVEAGPGDVLMYPPETAHVERVTGGDDADFVCFLIRGAPRHARPLVHDAGGRMRVLVDWLMRERASAHPDAGEMVDAIVALLTCEYDRLCDRPEPTIADRLREFLLPRLPEALTVEDLARSQAMSRAHFIRSYKRATGRTPMEELRTLRVAAARDLVVTTDLPLKAIALKVGLGDEHHLSHVFKRVLRVAPGYFRRSR